MSWGITTSGIAATVELLEGTRAGWSEAADAAYVVAPTVDYAVYQELGTSSIEARPFMRPAAARVNARPEAMIERYRSAAPAAGPIETLAIAVQNEAKQIADRKGVRDTGALINSITYEQL